ncbi:conserved protein of unknown function [Rhodovastum atsumiense]|uniref:Phage tail protein n=1 Tax=Rhodovastum atsumiense TaxID=504468 RepID=A0A5M6IYW8_9PROT|nr:hypothetical protein [Rhodovastum atsumiense]KAA5613481.1 hypothetical protein F1189_05340 [Rhodovastum atsumiense]CAH2603223.1 conserved protein of unknown function [Rhodovastum atsumiense]
MADLSHVWSGDFAMAPGGDLLLASGSEAGRQRVLRRLLTTPGEYIWQPEYGAGLPGQIGALTGDAALQAIVLTQMLQEDAVAQDPPPVVTVTRPSPGIVAIGIQYQDAQTGEAVLLGFSVAAEA